MTTERLLTSALRLAGLRKLGRSPDGASIVREAEATYGIRARRTPPVVQRLVRTPRRAHARSAAHVGSRRRLRAGLFTA